MSMRHVLTMFVLTASLAHAAPLPNSTDSTPIQLARKALDKRVSLKAENKPLSEVIENLGAQAKTELTIDASLQMFGFQANQLFVTMDIKDLPLNEAMNKVLAKWNLRCGLTRDGIVISTDEGIIQRQMRQRISIDADKILVGDLLKKLSDENGVELVIDPRAATIATSEKVSLKLTNTPVESVMRLSADLGGLGIVRMSNVLYVTTEARAEKLKHQSEGPAPAVPFSPVYPVDEGGGVVPVPVPGVAPGAPAIERAPLERVVPDKE